MTAEQLNKATEKFMEEDALVSTCTPGWSFGDVHHAHQFGYKQALADVQQLLKNWEGVHVGEFPTTDFLLQDYTELLPND